MDSVLAEQLKNYIEEQVYPDGYTDAEKRRLREKAARFIVSEKKRRLYWIEPKSGERRRVVIGEAAKLDILHAIHSDVGGGHYGQNNTWRKIKERYWWKGIVADVQKYRKTCDRCQRQNPDNKPQPDELHPIPVSSVLFERWGIDLVGPLKETRGGNRFLCVTTEYLTRTAEVWAIKDKRAETVAACLLQLVYRYGAARFLLHDQGTEFCNCLNKAICRSLNIKQTVASAYHPRTNGLTERFNATLVTGLLKQCNDARDDWDEQVDRVCAAYRMTQQSSTKHSPFQLLYGVRPRLPIEMDFGTDEADDAQLEWGEPSQEELEVRLAAVEKLIQQTREDGLGNLRAAQERQKRDHSLKHQGPRFKVGDRVLVLERRNKGRKGDKLKDRAVGPYVIAEALSKGVFYLQTDDGTRLKTKYNQTRLKPYFEPTEAQKESPTETPASPTPSPPPRASTPLSPPPTARAPSPSSPTTARATERARRVDQIALKKAAAVLKTKKWLTDEQMDMAQQLICNECPELRFQTVLKAQVKGGFVFVGAARSLQLVHDRDHWVLVGKDKGVVSLYDSLRRDLLSDWLTGQIRELHAESVAQMEVSLQPVGKQRDGYNCGVYAVAFAAELLAGGDPTKVLFDAAQLRPHLLQCFADKKLSPFPSAPRKALRDAKIDVIFI